MMEISQDDDGRNIFTFKISITNTSHPIVEQRLHNVVHNCQYFKLYRQFYHIVQCIKVSYLLSNIYVNTSSDSWWRMK